MRNILFIISNFEYGGGINTSLLGLLPKICNDYACSVFAINNVGQAREEIAKYAGILNPKPVSNASSSSKARRMAKAVFHFVNRLACFCFNINPRSIILKKFAKNIDAKRFDAVIAFAEGLPTELASYTHAPVLITWLHCMFSRYIMIVGDKEIERYKHFDKVVCVSKPAMRDFERSKPEFIGKAILVENAIDEERLKLLSQDTADIDKGCFNIVSIGRIDPVKRFSKIPEIAAAIASTGIKFIWTIVGGVAVPQEYELLKSNIAKFKMEAHVRVAGLMSNPYALLAKADLLACLSSSETFNYTLAESQFLGVPVVVADFDGAAEFVQNQRTGIVCPIDEMGNVISEVIQNTAILEDFRKNLAEKPIKTNDTLGQFSKIFES